MNRLTLWKNANCSPKTQDQLNNDGRIWNLFLKWLYLDTYYAALQFAAALLNISKGLGEGFVKN